MKHRACAYALLVFVFILNHAPMAWGQEKAAPVTVSGRVILDRNRNGRIDADEKGIPDVLVSDGVQWVRTAADGSYTLKIAPDPLLPYQPAQVVAVRWPSGTWPVAQHWFKRLSDVQPGQSVDFFLRPDEQRLPFTVVHATDPHNNLESSELFRNDVSRMGDKVQFSVFTGDLGYMGRDNADKAFTSIRTFTNNFPIPLLHTPGNHDIVDIHTTKWSHLDDLAGYGPYTKYLGPLRWSFDYAGTHFVGLDWARIMDDGKLQTGVPDSLLPWLEQDLKSLKPGTRTFVFMHHHHRPDEKFWDLLVRHKVELVLAGHSHRNLDQSRRGVKALTTMNLRGPYRLLTVHDTGHALVNRCHGCKDPDSGYHSKHCQLFLPPAKQGKTLLEVKDKEVQGNLELPGNLPRLGTIMMEVDPRDARRFGLRLGSKDKTDLEIACADNTLQVGVIHTAAVRSANQKTYQFHFVREKGVLRVFANQRVQFDQALPSDEALRAMLFVEGGSVMVRNLEIGAPD